MMMNGEDCEVAQQGSAAWSMTRYVWLWFLYLPFRIGRPVFATLISLSLFFSFPFLFL